MKKIMLSLLAIAATVNVMAINVDAKAKITISAGGEATTLLLVESPDLNEGWNNGYCGEIFDLNEYPLALYIQYGGKNYSSFGTKDLTANDIVLAAKDNGAASYTITVSNATNTTPLKLLFGTKEIPFVDGVYELTAAELAAATKVASAAAPAVQGICFNYNILTLTMYAGATVDVYPYGTTTAAVSATVAGDAPFDVDLNAQASGKYKVVVTIPGVVDPEEYIIDVKPAVTAVP